MKKTVVLFLLLLIVSITQAQVILKFPKLTFSKPISIKNKSNFTISGDSIVGNQSVCILLQNCHNVRITKCKLSNSVTMGIQLANCTNITIDSNYITKVSTGVYAQACSGIKVNYNAILNVQGPFPRGQSVQFNNVTGTGNRITYNMCDNVQGQSAPEDVINVYASSGLFIDPIVVSYNWIRGGGPRTSGAAITLGDQNGSYQVAMHNICVNSGAGGIQVAGGTNITVMFNEIYSDGFAWSNIGLMHGNYPSSKTGLKNPNNNITMAYNKVLWWAKLPGALSGFNKKLLVNGAREYDLQPSKVDGDGLPIIGWDTNIIGPASGMSTAILPKDIIIIK